VTLRLLLVSFSSLICTLLSHFKPATPATPRRCEVCEGTPRFGHMHTPR
jgi:hypothetical protein